LTMPALIALAEGRISWRAIVTGGAAFAAVAAFAGVRVRSDRAIPEAPPSAGFVPFLRRALIPCSWLLHPHRR
jgi:hypothetical protein